MGPVVVQRARRPALSFWVRAFPVLLAAALAGCAAVGDPGHPPMQSFRDCADCPELIALPPGRFLMGTPDDDPENWSPAREGPQHSVEIRRPFALGRFEVTRRQYREFALATGRADKGCYQATNGWVWNPSIDWQWPGFEQGEDEPVTCVAWADASAYADWLSVRTGRRYRLPTEAEWEYAARAGTTSSRHWGDNPNAGCEYANVSDLTAREVLGMTPSLDCADGHARTAPVGSFQPNPWGFFDMLGNVWEWTQDCWIEGYRDAPIDGSPRLDGPCTLRVNRGAAWNSHPRNMRSSNRGSYSPRAYESVGFRIARDVSP